MNLACGFLGKKIGMTQVFNPDGDRVGVTAVEVGPCVVLQKRTAEKDGYSALQLGFEDKLYHNSLYKIIKKGFRGQLFEKKAH